MSRKNVLFEQFVEQTKTLVEHSDTSTSIDDIDKPDSTLANLVNDKHLPSAQLEPGLDAHKLQSAATQVQRNLLCHQRGIYACSAIIFLLMTLSVVDLNSWVTTVAQIDPTLRIVGSGEKRPDLPAGVSYYHPGHGEFAIGPADATYYRETNFSDGLEPVLQSSWDSDKVGFVDRHGALVIAPQFADVRAFSEGLAAATPWRKIEKRKGERKDFFEQERRKWGVIDKSGKYVVPPLFRNQPHFIDGVAPVMLFGDGHGQGDVGLIDRSGNFIFRAKAGRRVPTWFEGVYIAQGQSGKTGLLKSGGDWVAEPQFDYIAPFDHFWESGGYDSITGSECYNDERDNPEKVLLMTLNGRQGVISRDGKILIPPKLDQILSYANEHAVVQGDTEKLGIADSAGRMVIPAMYDKISAYDDLIAAFDGEKWHILDNKGKEVTDVVIDFPVFRSNGLWFREGLAPVVVKGKFGFIDRSGKIAIEPHFLAATPFFHGYANVWDGRYWRFIDKRGQFVTPIKLVFPQAVRTDGKTNISMPGPLHFLRAPANADELTSDLKEFIEAQGVPRNLRRHYPRYSR